MVVRIYGSSAWPPSVLFAGRELVPVVDGGGEPSQLVIIHVPQVWQAHGSIKRLDQGDGHGPGASGGVVGAHASPSSALAPGKYMASHAAAY